MRVDVLQKRLAEQERKQKTSTANLEDELPARSKKMSTESNLLADIDDPDSNAFEEEIAKLNLKIQQLQAISNEKSTQISNFQNAVSAAEAKTKMLYSQHQENLGKAKQKYQEEQQKLKKEFDRILDEKNDQNASLKNLLMLAEKKYLEKQCEYYSLESKLKKTEALLFTKDRKIEEL